MKRNWHMALLYGIVAAMQVCWLGTALDLANQKAADGFLSILVVLGFYPLAFGFHRLRARGHQIHLGNGVPHPYPGCLVAHCRPGF